MRKSTWSCMKLGQEDVIHMGGGVSTKASENMTLKLRDLRNIQKFAK